MPAAVRRVLVVTAFLFPFTFLNAADSPAAAPGPNSDPSYQQLRNLTLGGEAVSVSNFVLKRDAGTFHLRSGTVCFVTPVNGKVTGAVFTGDGNFTLDPPAESERKSLKLLTKENEFSENFSQTVFRFTDSTYEEIKKSSGPAPVGCDPGLLKESQNTTRHKLKDNFEARILEDVLSPEPGEYFAAFVRGKRYNSKELFTIDPHSAADQVQLRTYDENKYGVWMGYNLSHAQRVPRCNLIHIEHQQLDTTIEKNARLTGKSTTTFVALVDGLRVVPFDLFPTLRVESVTSDTGQALSFIQEDKNDDADFAVILAKPLPRGDRCTVKMSYGGRAPFPMRGMATTIPLPVRIGTPTTAMRRWANIRHMT